MFKSTAIGQVLVLTARALVSTARNRWTKPHQAVSGRMIIEKAATMSAADLSVLVSAIHHSDSDSVELVTSTGSDNYVLWSLMTKKGWLIYKGRIMPHSPLNLTSFSVVNDYKAAIGSVAVVCFEAVRQGLTPEEILMLGDGPVDPRMAHLF